MKNLRAKLQEILQSRICLVGVGNVECGDDGFGVRLAEEARKFRVSSFEFRVMVAGCEPEQHLAELSNGEFDNVVFLDVVEFGGEPGAVVLLNSSEMAARFPQVSTHKLSLGLLAKLVESSGNTKAWLLGVQLESLRKGASLSPKVQASVELLADLLAEIAQTSGLPFRRLPVGQPPESRSACVVSWMDFGITAAMSVRILSGSDLTSSQERQFSSHSKAMASSANSNL